MNSIVVGCDECLHDIKRKISRKIKFNIPKFRDTLEESRKEILEFLISTLWYDYNCLDRPQSCRNEITKRLLMHGQFKKKEIDRLFEENSYESEDYTNEFIKNHPKIDFKELMLKKYIEPNNETKKLIEINYNFPHSGCSYVEFLGFCKIDVEMLKCPDCGLEVKNIPENVTYGYEHDLVCPVCLGKRVNEFDVRGLVKEGNPTHHGRWHTQEPELIYMATDYFAVLHPKCRKSKRPDGKGFMEVYGLWVDDCGRIVLSLKCIYCGARNALKPHKVSGKIPLLNESGATWKRIESPLEEIVEKGESDEAEFKSSLRWDYERNVVNKNLEYETARAMAAFMNTRGGVLLIGVDDNKNVLGLENDYKTLGKRKKNRDGFELQLTEVINRCIGKENRKFIRVSFEELYKIEVCFIEIERSPHPIFLRCKEKEFVIRSGNRTQTLDVEETTEYIKTHW